MKIKCVKERVILVPVEEELYENMTPQCIYKEINQNGLYRKFIEYRHLKELAEDIESLAEFKFTEIKQTNEKIQYK